MNKNYITYNQAKELLKQHSFQSRKEYEVFYDYNNIKLFPKDCYKYYSNKGWITWSDFLSNDNIQTNKRNILYVDYITAKNYVLNLNLKNKEEWYEFTKNNKLKINMPNRPDNFYHNKGWISWTDFLKDKESHLNRKFFAYDNAINFLKDKELSDRTEYLKYLDSNGILFLPKRPDKYYKNIGWCGWLNYLNSEKRLSIGEHKIKKWLYENNIEYKREYTFENFHNNKVRYKFDFYLPEYNMCIEYDGEQHFEVNDYFGGVKTLLDIQKRDIIKNEYCKYNKINLIRIPYININNIDNILNKYFN